MSTLFPVWYGAPVSALASIMCCRVSSDSPVVSGSLCSGTVSSRSRLRLRRDIMWVFLMLLPKKMYNMMPPTGNSISTVIQARDFSGFLFSDSMMPMMLRIVPR